MRANWKALAWFALAVLAALMAACSWNSPRLPSARPGLPALPVAPAIVRAPGRVGAAAALVRPPRPTPSRVAKPAGSRLLKCSEHGEVTYTNDPQDCVGAPVSRSIVVYPTQGYEPYRR
jgi:hypothetical protein